MVGPRLVTDRVFATVGREGLVRLTVPPADPECPIAVGDNDPRLVGNPMAILAETLATNTCVRLAEGMVHRVTASEADAPWIDGVLLESGNAGDVRPLANVTQRPYETPLELPAGRMLFLGLDGQLTDVVPDPAAGYRWLVLAARRIDAHHFVFSPTQPIRLGFS